MMRRGAERSSRGGGRDFDTTSCIYSSVLPSERMDNDWVKLPQEGMNNHRDYIIPKKEATSPKRTRFDLKERTEPTPSHPHQGKEQQHMCIFFLYKCGRLTLSKELDLGCWAAGEVVGVC